MKENKRKMIVGIITEFLMYKKTKCTEYCCTIAIPQKGRQSVKLYNKRLQKVNFLETLRTFF